MDDLALQDKIDKLHCTVFTLLHSTYLYTDELAIWNLNIHRQIEELYTFHGASVEQEASLCLAILMGYSVMMYANPEDEFRKQEILERAQKIIEKKDPISLKKQLLDICQEYERDYNILK